jgi:hypothetical protein
MGLRFSRRMRVMPGVTQNLSKGGVSTSLGVRGAHLTLGGKGVRTTVRVVFRDYNLTPEEQANFDKIKSTHAALASCRGRWYIPSAGQVQDLTTWKRQAGADS